ncbi:MAG: leucine-rich repeat protein [Clostridia bacterium]|nr:leucine-rich repeat protein [Clostridia bacterium]
MKKTVILLIVLTLVCALSFACGDSGEAKTDDTGNQTGSDSAVTFRVAVESGEGFSVAGGGTAQVALGESARFEITIGEGYEFVSVSDGTFDGETLVIPSVSRPLTVTFTVRLKPVPKENYTVSVGEADFGSITGGGVFEDGSEVTLRWESDGEHTVSAWLGADGAVLARGGEEYTFTASEDVTVSVKCARRVLVYHANGGTNIKTGEETFVQDFDHDVYIYANAMGEELFSTFEREGYFPIEYNTEPDGSGEAVSIGSKALIDDRLLDLYIVWAKESPAEDFEYTSDSTGGLMLTAYKGSEETVVIPCEINGEPVTAVAANAFKNLNIRTLVITKNVRKIANSAVYGCKKLETLYLSDTVSDISDSSFFGCTSLSNLRMIAVLPPCFTNNYLSPFVQKLEHVAAAKERKKIIFVGSSSMDYGFDGAYYDSVFGDEYTIINCGLNAQVPGQFVIDVIEDYLGPDDVVVMSCEAGSFTGGNLLEWTWCALESCYDVFRHIDLYDFGTLFSAYNTFMNGSRFGKLNVINSGKQKTYADVNINYNNKYAELVAVRNYDSSRTYNKDIAFASNRFDADRVFAFNDLAERLSDRGARLYFTFFPVYEGAVYTDANGRRNYENYLRNNLDFPVISTIDDYMFTAENIYDSAVHCTNAGALLRSQKLAADIAAQLAKDAE